MKHLKCLSICMIFALLFVAGCSGQTQEDTGQATQTREVNLYFVKESTNQLAVEQRELSYEQEEDLPTLAVQELLAGPKQAGMVRTFPDNVQLLGCSWSGDDTIIVNFSSEYSSIDSATELLARYSVVQTLCELPNVDSVILLVDGKNLVGSDGQQLGKLTKENIVLNPDATQQKEQTITLYFADAQGQYLVPETRSVVVSDTDGLEKTIVNELINGPQNQDLVATIPVGTRLLSIEVSDGTCFVNFSQDLISRHSGGSAGETMTIYSVVNSLTELPGIQQVMFLIEGQRVDVFLSMLLNEPFVRDETLIQP